MSVRFGRQTRGHEGWIINNPKATIVKEYAPTTTTTGWIRTFTCVTQNACVGTVSKNVQNGTAKCCSIGSPENEICRLLRWNQNNYCNSGCCFKKLLLTRKQKYLLVGGDRAGCNAVFAEQDNIMFHNHVRRYWGVSAETAERVSDYWQAEKQWLEWEALWPSKPSQSDVITWNIGPQRVDLSFYQIAQTLSTGVAVVMLQEVMMLPFICSCRNKKYL